MKNKTATFLIINPFGIGDVLFSTSLIQNINEFFPDSKINYLCNRRAYPVLENHPLVNRIFVYERDEFEVIKQKSKSKWLMAIGRLISQIRKEKIDIVFDLSLNSQFGFFA